MSIRKKASEIYQNNLASLLWEQVSFEDAFPEILEISGKIRILGYCDKEEDYIPLSKENVHEWIDCTNDKCTCWWFNLTDILRSMCCNKKEKYIDRVFCIWYIGSSKHKKKCHYSFQIEINLRYQ